MAWQHTIYAYPILFVTAISLLLAAHAIGYSRRHERAPTLYVFAAMNVAIAVWTGFSAIKLLSTDPTVQFHAYRLLYLGSSSVGPLLLLFALAYTDRTRWLRRHVVVGVFVVPVVFWILLFTNPYDVVIVETRIVEVDGLVIMRATTGPARVAFSFVYAGVIAVLTLGIVLSEAHRRGRSYLPQASLLGLAIVTPMAVSFLTAAGVYPFDHDGVNFVPVSTAVSSAALGFATFRYRLLDLQPIAHRTVVDHSPDGVLVLNADERIVHANETAHSLLGENAPAIGEPLESVHPSFDVAPGADVTVELAADAGESTFLDVRSQPLRRRGEAVGSVVVLRDVTERLRRERELEAFTGVISHDLREPLRTTERYLALLEDRSASSLDEEALALLAVARENNQRMQAMITELLRYTRIGATDVEFGPVDCDRLVSDVLEVLRFEIDDRDATVDVDSLPAVYGADHLLRRLFQNLLVNALRHADSEAPTVRVAATREGDFWRFSVRDDGVGIEPADLEYVFELFTRGSGSDPDSGTGMGLAICQKIVERHGGTIDIESTPGVGTEVTFTLPVTQRVPRPEDRAQTASRADERRHVPEKLH